MSKNDVIQEKKSAKQYAREKHIFVPKMHRKYIHICIEEM